METIQIPSRLTEIEFESFIRSFNSGKHIPDRTIQFDFSKTAFISSFAMIEFILLCEFIISELGKHISFHLSSSSRLSSCMFVLSRLGFFDCFPNSVTFYPYKPKRKKPARGKNEAILEITEVNEDKAEQVIDLVDKAVSKNTTYDRSQVNDICIMVSEMLQNIFYHSQSDRAGLIAIQNYSKLRFMQMVIADAGIGIPGTIRNAPEYAGKELNDVEAIFESIKKGVSRLGRGAGRGEGLTHCVQLANKHQARLYIRSNSGWASITLHKGRGKTGIGEHLSGTQIFVNFPLN